MAVNRNPNHGRPPKGTPEPKDSGDAPNPRSGGGQIKPATHGVGGGVVSVKPKPMTEQANLIKNAPAGTYKVPLNTPAHVIPSIPKKGTPNPHNIHR